MKTEIKSSCYEYVHLSLETYDCLNKQINTLSKLCAKEQEEKKELEDKITDLTCEIEILKLSVLKSKLNAFRLGNYSLDDCLDYDGWRYPFDDVDDLLKLGFTHEELNNFIKEEWKKLNRV